MTKTSKRPTWRPRPGVRGCVLKADITNPSNYRATKHLDAWLKARGIIGIAGIDTRALTTLIREKAWPMPSSPTIRRPPSTSTLSKGEAAEWPGLEGMDLAREVSATQRYDWNEKLWQWDEGYSQQTKPRFNVVAMDFGAKRNILRCLAEQGCNVTVVPATTSAEDILAMNPDGVFLSNGPGDPAATGNMPCRNRKLVASGKPVFGICLGHQMLALALGARPSRCTRAITAPTIRSRTTPPARSRSPR
jgi:carbamoyl-phosphate synthase small subunit